ncbi:ras guanine nucleotide exchange factor domain-containing protein [Mycena sanguinolenta]|nr:ras guanine nucleotide exchange factor domain-containing protein [Mycena sanguinolenta]
MGDTKILIYEASFSFLKTACSVRLPGRSWREVRMLQRTVEDCITSMTCDSVLSGIVESLTCRNRVLELSNKLELTNDPNLRTAIRADEERIASFLVSILSSKSDEETVLRLEGDSAQQFLDVVQETLDKGFIVAKEHTKMARRIIRKLSVLCDKLPSSLFIVGVTEQDEHPTFWGGFGDIYRASYGNQRVALKRMRHFQPGSDVRRMRLKFCREALVWKDLHHPHILPFLGIDADSFPLFLCMVSPWMMHGTVLNYLKTHCHANLDKLLYEIAQGLEYLHSRNVVHGDLRGTNILIKEDWSACLADFGLSILSDTTSTASTNRGGSTYWMAPELLDPDRFGIKFARTAATDVYAFGCVCVELYTKRPPFSNVSETAALFKILSGERPERPSGPPAMSDTLWRHVTECWAENPATRPSTQSIVQAITWPPTDLKHSRLQLRFGPHPVKDSFPPDVIPTAKVTTQPDTSSSIPFSTDDELEKDLLLQPNGIVSNGPHSPRFLHLLSVLADGGIGTAEYVGVEHQWLEVQLQDGPLMNPEAKGLTVHFGTETLPVWQAIKSQEAPPVDAKATSLSPVSRRRSLLSITAVEDSDVTGRPGIPVGLVAEASTGYESSGLLLMQSQATDVTSPDSDLPYLSSSKTPFDPDLPSSTSLIYADDGTTRKGSRAQAMEESSEARILHGDLPGVPVKHFELVITKFVQDPVAGMLSHDHSPEDAEYDTDRHLVGATIDVLVEKMTPHDSIVDHAFSAVFFLTFRLFSSPIELVNTIIRRYSLFEFPPDGISNEDVQLWQQRKGIPVRLRVSNFIKMWVKIYWQPGVDDPALEPLAVFARDRLAVVFSGPAQRIQEWVDLRRMAAKLVMRTQAHGISINPPIAANPPISATPIGEIPRSSMTKALLANLRSKNFGAITITDFDPLELARQLTIMECNLYCAIQPEEVLETGQDGAKPPLNVKAISSLSTAITGWVAENILGEPGTKKRTHLVKFFIKVADWCTSLHNDSTSLAMLAALDSVAISRLHQTWLGLPQKNKSQMNALRRLADHSRNYPEYRSKLDNTAPPAVPFLGLYLTDVAFCRKGDPSHRPSPMNPNKKLLNFNKYRKLARIVQDMQRFQVPYQLQAIPEVQIYLNYCFENSRHGDRQALYRRRPLTTQQQ